MTDKFIVKELGRGKSKHEFPKQISETTAQRYTKAGKPPVFDSKQEAQEHIKQPVKGQEEK